MLLKDLNYLFYFLKPYQIYSMKYYPDWKICSQLTSTAVHFLKKDCPV